MTSRYLFVLATPLLLAGPHRIIRPDPSPLATIAPNNNRTPAGTLRDGVLTMVLEPRMGMWYPEGPAGKGLEVAAWAEAGKGLSTPGPLIRVPLGTALRVTVSNPFADTLHVYGLGVRGAADSLLLAPQERRTVVFTPPAAGTFYYYARGLPGPMDSQLNGAIVIDDPHARQLTDDRVMFISWWNIVDTTSPTDIDMGTMAINGLSWPHTERILMTQGDSVRWRILNLTGAPHPMHLHGFYFQMESAGDGVRDTLYAPAAHRLAVTEVVNPGATATFVWAPTEPGNWIYHCHFIGHLDHVSSLDTKMGVYHGPDTGEHGGMAHQMFGLVLGIQVAPKPGWLGHSGAARPIRLEVRQRAGMYGDHPGYSFVLGGTPEAADPSAMPMPGSTLILQRGERVAITIVNHAKEPAAVHWHGIELESPADGVPDWSGMGERYVPSVAPGDSLTVRFTPPRAGTFMYHSHFNENAQIASGLYAPIVVLEPGEQFDPAVDHILFFSSAGPTRKVILGPFAPTLLNGRREPDTLHLAAGRVHRFRLIAMTWDLPTEVTLGQDSLPAQWRLVAKDGAATVPGQQTLRPATQTLQAGEIYDFAFTPPRAGLYRFDFGPPDFPESPGRAIMPIRVH